MTKRRVHRRAHSSKLFKMFDDFFDYETPKQVHVNSKCVGFLNRLIQLGIVTYIGGYAILWQRGYQEFDNVVSGLTTKLKGVVYSNYTDLRTPELNHRIFDVADYVIPAQENDAFFVMTNALITPNQTQGACSEDPSLRQLVYCRTDDDCPRGIPVVNGNGVRTGRCVLSTWKPEVKVCEVYAWCPVEVLDLADIPPLHTTSLLSGSQYFTVLIKNHIEFPKFNITRSNILDTQNNNYLRGCRYNSSHVNDSLCPIFQLDTIIKEARIDNYEDIAVFGGVIGIHIHWECNLDYDVSYCIPSYKFSRLDLKNAKIAKGLNFRYGRYYSEAGVEKRDLIKAYGIRFIIKVTGRAGKFSIVPLLLNIGSGIGLLAISTIICDVVLINVLRKGDYYKKHKFSYIDDNVQDATRDYELSFKLNGNATEDICLQNKGAQQYHQCCHHCKYNDGQLQDAEEELPPAFESQASLDRDY